jgi:hypothetical protein
LVLTATRSPNTGAARKCSDDENECLVHCRLGQQGNLCCWMVELIKFAEASHWQKASIQASRRQLATRGRQIEENSIGGCRSRTGALMGRCICTSASKFNYLMSCAHLRKYTDGMSLSRTPIIRAQAAKCRRPRPHVVRDGVYRQAKKQKNKKKMRIGRQSALYINSNKVQVSKQADQIYILPGVLCTTQHERRQSNHASTRKIDADRQKSECCRWVSNTSPTTAGNSGCHSLQLDLARLIY